MNPRAPQGPIQRAFTGLLGMLDLKGSEAAPNSMQGFITPTLDVRQHLLAGSLRSFESAGTTAFSTAQFIGGTTPVRVPDGKVWVVQAATCYLNVAVGNSNFNQWIAMRRAGAITTMAYNLGMCANVQDAFTLAQLGSAGFVGPLVVPSGWEFGIGLGGIGAVGPFTFNIGVLASEFNA